MLPTPPPPRSLKASSPTSTSLQIPNAGGWEHGCHQRRTLSLLPPGLLTSFILHLHGTDEEMTARHFAASATDKCLRWDAQGTCEGKSLGRRGRCFWPRSLADATLPPQTAAALCSPTGTPACPTALRATTAVSRDPPPTQPASVPAATPPATRAGALRPTTARPVLLPAPSMSSPAPAPLRRASPPRRGCRVTFSLSLSAGPSSSLPSSMSHTVWPFASRKVAPAVPRLEGQNDTSLGCTDTGGWIPAWDRAALAWLPK